ncbi:hypothetical protein QTP88_004767 [Uroleucon formosanum]
MELNRALRGVKIAVAAFQGEKYRQIDMTVLLVRQTKCKYNNILSPCTLFECDKILTKQEVGDVIICPLKHARCIFKIIYCYLIALQYKLQFVDFKQIARNLLILNRYSYIYTFYEIKRASKAPISNNGAITLKH